MRSTEDSKELNPLLPFRLAGSNLDQGREPSYGQILGQFRHLTLEVFKVPQLSVLCLKFANLD